MVNTITNRQMFFILALALTSFNVITIPKEMAATAGTGSWLVLLVASLFFGFMAVVVASLNNRFHGKTLYEYAALLITRPGALALTFLYIGYFIFLTVSLSVQQARVLQVAFFPQTPVWAFPALSIPVFCYIAHKGVTTMARLCELVGIVFLLTGTFVHIVMLTEGNTNRILPLFNNQEIDDYLLALKSTVSPFTPISVLLTIPFTQKNGSKSKKAAFFSLIAIGLFYVLIVVSSIMKVGLNDITHYDDALIIAIRDTAPQFLELIARLDILFLTVGFTGTFMGIAIILTAATELLCRIFKQASRAVIVIALGVLILGLTVWAYGVKNFTDTSSEVRVYVSILAITIPAVLLIIAVLKGRKEKSNAS